MSVQQIKNLQLPQCFPTKEAIRLSGHNLHSYEPEFWEFQYQCYRYLERTPTSILEARYQDILRNMKALICRERDVIPIQSFLSSWYWFRKEHQTRQEFTLRHAALPIEPPFDTVFDNLALGAPARPCYPNASDLLFRYDQRIYTEGLVRNGSLRIRPASDFKNMESDRARQDDECSKKAFRPGAHTRITMENGQNVPILGDLEHTKSVPNYYIFCMASDWDQDLFTDFEGADTCIVIKDVEEFARRIEIAAAIQLPGWYFYHNAIQYFDPYEQVKNEYFDAAMSKDFRFAYQREYRFLWIPKNGEPVDEFKFLTLGNLGDFAEVHGNR